MTQPLQRAQRLVEAIDTLLTEEDICLKSGGDGVAAIHKRSKPLVEELVRLTVHPEVLPLKARIQALMSRRQALTALMQGRVAEIRARMAQLNLSQGNLRRMAPMYKEAPVPRRLAEIV